jgi:hypothetical protein
LFAVFDPLAITSVITRQTPLHRLGYIIRVTWRLHIAAYGGIDGCCTIRATCIRTSATAGWLLRALLPSAASRMLHRQCDLPRPDVCELLLRFWLIADYSRPVQYPHAIRRYVSIGELVRLLVSHYALEGLCLHSA